MHEEEKDATYELSVNRAFRIAQGLARVACTGLTEQQHITKKSLDAIELYLKIVLAESIGPDSRETSDINEKYVLASRAVRESVEDVVTRAHAIRAGKRIAVSSLQLARRTVLLGQTSHQRP